MLTDRPDCTHDRNPRSQQLREASAQLGQTSAEAMQEAETVREESQQLRDVLRQQLAAPPESEKARRSRRGVQAYLATHPGARHWYTPQPTTALSHYSRERNSR